MLPLNLVFGYVTEVVAVSGDIVRMVKSDFTDEYGFGSLQARS